MGTPVGDSTPNKVPGPSMFGFRDFGNYRKCLMTARCASATNPVEPGTTDVIPPTKTQAAGPDETLAHA